MKELEYILAQDVTRVRIALDVLDGIEAPSAEVQTIRVALHRLLEKGCNAVERKLAKGTK